MVPSPAPQPARGGPTATRPRGTVLLVTGGVLSALNGAAHFVLPVIYPWAEHVEGLYEPVGWALYATTVFFGILLVFGGVVTVAVTVWREVPWRVVALVGGGMAGFWAVGAVYEILVPFPAPGASWALPLFSIIVALLYLVGLWLHRGSVDQRHSEVAARDHHRQTDASEQQPRVMPPSAHHAPDNEEVRQDAPP